ncbi:hypothetical protein GTY23_28755 [Streptomyces sp. SID5998]|nr:hypothetical protein [Streptomyces sp. SID5998]
MKFIDIWDLKVTAGQLTVWRPTAGPPHSSDWMPDARPASYLQEAHLNDALNSAAGGRGPSWLATSFELPGPLDEYALCKAFTDWINRHEVLRSRLEPYADGDVLGMYRSTLRPGAVGLMRAEHGHVDDPRELSARLEAVLDGSTDPLAWPSFVFLTVRRPDSTTVCVGLDHHNVDGYAVLLIAHEIRELYAAALDDRRACLTEVGSYLDFAGPERQDAAGCTATTKPSGSGGSSWPKAAAGCPSSSSRSPTGTPRRRSPRPAAWTGCWTRRAHAPSRWSAGAAAATSSPVCSPASPWPVNVSRGRRTSAP